MRFASIYSPSYGVEKKSSFESIGKYWRILFIVLALHCLVVFFLSKRSTISEVLNNDEIIIDVAPPIVVPEIAPEIINAEQSEKIGATKSTLVATPKAAPVQPIQAPSSIDSAPIMKFNEEAIKLANKPVKVERVEDKQVPTAVVEKVQEKKIPEPIPIKAPVQADTKVSAPVEEATSNLLPALVDKKNKDKDAPEVPPPGKTASSPASVSGDSTKSSSATNPATSAGPSESSSGSPAATASIASGSEIQAQLSSSGSASGASSGNAGTADADYKSESLRNAQPRYPIYSRKMRQEGVVILTAEVLTDGSAIDVRMAVSSGIQLLDEAALETVKQWRFIPAKRDGMPYVQRLRIPVTFSLNNR